MKTFPSGNKYEVDQDKQEELAFSFVLVSARANGKMENIMAKES